MASLWKWLADNFRFLLSTFLFCVFNLNTACFAKTSSEKTPPSSVQSAQQQRAASEPTVQFEKTKITLGHKTIPVELAKTPEQHERGLMYRNTLAKDEGMLFIFDEERTLSFWMKNTYIDLAIAYFNKDQKIVDIQEMKATNALMLATPPSYPSTSPAQYALEMNAGWFKNNKIRKGDKFTFKQ